MYLVRFHRKMEVLRRVHGRQEYIVGTYNNQLQAAVHPPGVVSSEPTSYLNSTHKNVCLEKLSWRQWEFPGEV